MQCDQTANYCLRDRVNLRHLPNLYASLFSYDKRNCRQRMASGSKFLQEAAMEFQFGPLYICVPCVAHCSV
jgi:hypothetical protein